MYCRCLLYQACVFNFGNEFCQRDPYPGNRKNINLNITCVADSLKVNVVDLPAAEVTSRTESVLNIVFESKLDFGIEDFENTELTDRVVPEKFVFDGSCAPDPVGAGFGGSCSTLELEQQTVVQNRLWPLVLW